ncbi:21459_t:CDS:2, partial [Cetraspora pellucida]
YKEKGFKFGMFSTIAYYTGILWKSLGKSKESFESLITQLRQYKMQKHSDRTPNAYTMPYSFNKDTLLNSTNTITDNLELEIKTFIDFNSLIFKSYNDNNDDLLKNENFESN